MGEKDAERDASSPSVSPHVTRRLQLDSPDVSVAAQESTINRHSSFQCMLLLQNACSLCGVLSFASTSGYTD